MVSLTPAVTRAVESARAYAAGRGAAAVEPIDLLHGLLEDEEGRAFTLACQAGLDAVRYNQHRTALPRLPSPDLPTSLTVETLLFEARSLTVERNGETAVSSESALLSLLQTDGKSAVWTASLGLSLPRLEALLLPERSAMPLDDPLELADLTESVEMARLLDVGFNRAREALRVVEDYCRFALEDVLLTGELKELRHALTAAVNELVPADLLAARETQTDVGTTLSASGEMERSSLAEVAQVNLKRLQESLRSLEEFAKVGRPLLAERLEQMRYRVYTLERAIVPRGQSKRLLEQVKICVLLTGSQCACALDWIIAEAAAAGAGMFQLREKQLTDRQLIARAREVRRWTQQVGALFLVNDRPDIARLVEADGVHLGQDDLPVKEARRIVGPQALIGVSTHDLSQVRQAVLDGANYLGVGPVFPSRTKNFENFPGLAFVRSALAATTLPAFVIGGIGLENIRQVVDVGARRVAVSSAIAESDDPGAVTRRLRAALP